MNERVKFVQDAQSDFLTMAVRCARCVLTCHGLLDEMRVGEAHRRARLSRLRLAGAIRTNQGVPFATAAICGRSFLNVYRMQLGIVHQRIHPASPQENGAHERTHRTLAKRSSKPVRQTCAAQQRHFSAFRREDNTERPHEALGQTTPAARDTASPRPFPSRLPHLEYPGHFLVKTIATAGAGRSTSTPSCWPHSTNVMTSFSADSRVKPVTGLKCCNACSRSCTRYFDLEKYFTPGKSLKSASNVQMVASNCFAVAKMMLSANGNLCTMPQCAALKAIPLPRGTILPWCKTAATCRAASSSRCCITRRVTSRSTMVGTNRRSIFSMAAATCCACVPPAKYSSHADESIKFTRGPGHAARRCRCLSEIRASCASPGLE